MFFRALTSLALLPTAPVPPSPTDSLDVVSVDRAGRSEIVVEVVVPVARPDTLIADATFTIVGGRVTAVVPVTADRVAVALVLDDRPAVDGEALVATQGAAVELVRLLRPGTAVAVATPGGIRGAPTTDRQSAIDTVASIEPGRAARSTLAETVHRAAADLGRTSAVDRHLVAITGGPARASNLELATLALRLADGGVRLSVVNAGTRPDRELTDVADVGAASPLEGITPAGPIDAIDDVTGFIDNRLLVTVDVEGAGPHVLRVSLGGSQYTARFELEPTSAPTGTTEVSSSTPVTTVTDSRRGEPSEPAPADTGTTPSTVAPAGTASVTTGIDPVPGASGSSTSGGSPVPWLIAAAIALVFGGLVFAVNRRRRLADIDDDYGYGHY